MTEKEAKEKGYEIVAASLFEIGLLKNNRGVEAFLVVRSNMLRIPRI